MGKSVRLDKYLCKTLDVSRKDAKEYIRKGRVKVDDLVVKKSEMKVEEGQEVSFDGQNLSYEEFHYFMLHKPAGVVSATKDNTCETVIDLLDEPNKDQLFLVGRLDKDTEGLMIITNDGDLSHRLVSPRHHVDKKYFARIEGPMDEDAVEMFRRGVPIGNGEMAKPATLEIISTKGKEQEAYITITEGKFHQVKRMVKSVGGEVIYLKRLSVGSLQLDESLELGQYRRLTKEELDKLKEL